VIISIPDDFHDHKVFDSIQADGMILLNYKSYSANQKVYAFNDTNLLIFILKGSKIVYCADEKFIAKSGELVFIKKGNYIMNQIADLEEEKYECIIACLNDNLLDQFYNQYESFIFKAFAKGEPLGHEFKQKVSLFLQKELESLLIYFTNANDYPEEIIKLKFYEILLNMISDGNAPKELLKYFKDASQRSNISFKQFMEENFDRPYNIEKFAKVVGKSLSSFKKCFKDEFKNTPKNWINIKRLQKACGMLMATNYNITEICYLVGFEDLSYFIRLFKKKYGLPPGEYRVNNKTL
jgi:AraC-like DNA-binding protein